MSEFEKLIRKLDDLTSSANTSCSEFTNILIALGFEIENCGSAGHKIARHPAVSLIEYSFYIATKEETLLDPLKPVQVAQTVVTPATKSSLSMVSDLVDWSQVAACVANKTNCVCYGHKAQRLNIMPETCESAVKFGWITTKQL